MVDTTAMTGRISELKYRGNAIYSSVFVVDFKYAHVNTLFSIVLAVSRRPQHKNKHQ